MRPDGTHPHRILRTRQNAKRPSLSHDRRWIVFDGAPPGEAPLSDFDIQIVRPNGNGRRTLTRSSDWDIDGQWSPDDSTISFTRMPEGGNSPTTSLWTIRRDGSDLSSLGDGSSARWSPDGERLVISAPGARDLGDLFVINRDGSGRRLLLASPRIDSPTDWSRGGKKILFTRWYRDRVSAVFVMNADGTGARKLARGWGATWSPDGSHILYVRDFQLFTMRPDGSRRHRLSTVQARDPDWG